MAAAGGPGARYGRFYDLEGGGGSPGPLPGPWRRPHGAASSAAAEWAGGRESAHRPATWRSTREADPTATEGVRRVLRGLLLPSPQRVACLFHSWVCLLDLRDWVTGRPGLLGARGGERSEPERVPNRNGPAGFTPPPRVRAASGLRRIWPAHPTVLGLLSDSCSTGPRFASGFVQIPPRDSHPCLRLSGSVLPPSVRDSHSSHGACLDRDRGGPAIPVLPLPHHQACGSAPGGSVS